MVAVPFRHLVFLVNSVLRDPDHLCGSGFAGHHVGDIHADFARRAALAVDHVTHGSVNRIPVLGLCHHRRQQGRGYRFAIHTAHEPGRTAFAPGGQRAGRHRQLHRRGKHVALADTRTEGLTGVPRLGHGLALPTGRGQYPAPLARGVDVGALTEAKGVQVVVHAVDGEAPRQVVEIDVAGLDDGHVQVDPGCVAGAADFQNPVAVAPGIAGQAVPAGIGHRGLGGDQPGLQAGEPHHRFHRRARGVLALDRAIEQRHIQRIAQGAVVLAADPVDEEVGVKPRGRYQRHDAAGQGIDRHDGSALFAQRLVSGALQVYIEVQGEIGARRRIVAFQHPQYPPVGIGLHILVTASTARSSSVRRKRRGTAS